MSGDMAIVNGSASAIAKEPHIRLDPEKFANREVLFINLTPNDIRLNFGEDSSTIAPAKLDGVDLTGSGLLGAKKVVSAIEDEQNFKQHMANGGLVVYLLDSGTTFGRVLAIKLTDKGWNIGGDRPARQMFILHNFSANQETQSPANFSLETTNFPKMLF